MRQRIVHLWDRVRSSYWSVPLALCLSALFLSLLLPRVDRELVEAGHPFPQWMYLPANTLRAVLPAIGGSMLSITGTVFSVIMVVLSLTSSQFGPRLLRTFMEDVVNQFTLGMFLATGLYALLLLPYVGEAAERQVLAISGAVALLLVLISILVLIYYVHHVAVSIQAPTVVRNVANEFDAAILRLTNAEPSNTFEAEVPECVGRQLSVEKEGYLLSIDQAGALSLAAREEVLLRFLVRPGDFIAPATPVVEIFSEREEIASEQIAKLFIVGTRRSPRNDLECSATELVEIAVRALSPGINDPFTAIAVVDSLGAALCHLAQRFFPSFQLLDEENQLRVLLRPLKFSAVLNACFNQIRQAAQGDLAVSLRLLESLQHIELCSEESEIHKAIGSQAVAIYESFSEQKGLTALDRRALEERFARLERSRRLLERRDD